MRSTRSRASSPAAVPHRGVRPQRPAADPLRARPAVTASRVSGRTTSITRCMPRSPVSGRATTSTSARCETLADAMIAPYVHAGTWSTFRGRAHGRPLDPGSRRATGSSPTCRTTTRSATARPATGCRRRCRPGLLKVGAALLLVLAVHADAVHGRGVGRLDAVAVLHLLPEPELAQAVRDGRGGGVRRARLVGRATCRTRRTPRRSSGPGWTGPRWTRTATATLLDWHRRLIALRRVHPELSDPRRDLVRTAYDEDARWLVLYRDRHRRRLQPRAASGRRCRWRAIRTACCCASAGGFVFRPERDRAGRASRSQSSRLRDRHRRSSPPSTCPIRPSSSGLDPLPWPSPRIHPGTVRRTRRVLSPPHCRLEPSDRSGGPIVPRKTSAGHGVKPTTVGRANPSARTRQLTS